MQLLVSTTQQKQNLGFFRPWDGSWFEYFPNKSGKKKMQDALKNVIVT